MIRKTLSVLLPVAVAAVLLIDGKIRETSGQQKVPFPYDKDAFHFAVIGDTGTGGSDQYKVAERLTEMQSAYPFNVVIMMGDNLYGGESPGDFEKKFEIPYATLLSRG